MFSFELPLSALKLDLQPQPGVKQPTDASVAREYSPEFRIRSEAVTASFHFDVPFCSPAAVTVPVKTSALTYRLARMASAAPWVMRPFMAADHVAGSPVRAAISSASMKLNTSARVFRSRASIPIPVQSGLPSSEQTIGTP